MDWRAYERLENYPVDDATRDRLFDEQLECSVAWTTSDGWPVAVIHWFVWHHERFWVTAGSFRKRVAALRHRPESCVVVSGAGTSLPPAVSVTAKTIAEVHTDAATGAWFFPALARKAHHDNEVMAEQFERMLHGTDRVVLELTPVKYISYDSTLMRRALRGSGLLG